MLPAVLRAQTVEHDHTHQVCGTLLFGTMDQHEVLANTRHNNPERYQRMMERSKLASRPVVLGAAAVTNVFYVLNRVTQEYDEITGVRVFNGRRSRIWVDVADTARIKATTIAALARGLDTATVAGSRNTSKGIIENDEEVYGMPPINRFDDATPLVQDFLLTDIQDGLSGGGYVAGYFSPMDQGDFGGSNRMNLLYIDSRQGLGSQTASNISNVLSTLAHEYQHLIHYAQNPNSQVFYNEGCSEEASLLCGYKSRSNSSYMTTPNVALFRWSYDDQTSLGVDYERAMTFAHYCREQYGEAFLTKLAASRTTGINRLADALQKIGSTSDWKKTLKGFVVANYVRRNFADPRYIYQFALSNSSAKVYNTYADTGVASGQASVQQYASYNIAFNFRKPSGIRIRFNAATAGNYAVMALLYENGTLMDVRELTNNTVNTIEGNPGYNRIVFAIVSLTNNSQTVSWTVDAITSGVESESVAGTAGIQDVTPNPASSPVRVTYRTLTSTPAALDLYDMNGRLVRSVVGASEPGTHTAVIDPAGLPAGAYIVRMTQGPAFWTRAVVLQR